ncbi:hypothetical protein E2K80_04040 [Rhodophyticola sp. CCM32]|uniref:hypothetical protein n=1 Tax=Rhodophyticola sp. CCM32 TaxID=2916397 RepID=UPI00107F4B69|nr:hypothetical protein [Rhodophyticola sp. CCM32]QBY00010.1 hypothetical protein E2K80_04040 [Rhodophyticola sp. CCM32]
MTRHIEELLVFYANGTLEEAERAEVEAALADDANLRAELEALLALRETMQAEVLQTPGELGLARLMRDVEADRAGSATPQPADNVVPIRQMRIWQIAAAVVLTVALAQTVIVYSGSDQSGYELASGEGAAEADFVVGFAADATEARIRALLLDAGVEIVAGPSALGLYELSVLDDVANATAQEVLETAGQDGVIETLEIAAP